MSLSKKVFSNFALQIISRTIALLAGTLIISLMMRYLGPRHYGYYSISIAFLQVFGIIADFGLYLISLRYLGEAESLPSKEKESRISYLMGNIFSLRLFSAFIFYGGAFALSFLFPYPQIVKVAIGILSASLFFCTLVQTLSAFYQKMLATQSIFWGEVLGKIITLFLMLFLISRQASFYLILAPFVFGNLVNFLILFFKAKAWISLRFRFDLIFWKKILKKCWPIGLAIIFNVFYFKADTLILSFYYPAKEVGYYGGAYRVLEVLITIPPLFLGLVLPRLTQAWASHNLEKLKELFQKSFDFLVMLAWPLILGTVILGKKIMILIGGPQFGPAGDILRIVIIGCGILFVGELFKQLAVSLGQQKKILPFYLTTALFSLIGYFIFIPLYSYWGAALMTILSEFLMFFFAFFLFYRLTKILPSLTFFWKSLGASLLMALVLFWLRDWSIFFLIFLAPLIYFSALYLIGARPHKLSA